MPRDKLNLNQQRAVDIKRGPALIVAGAGTGKTKVIVERIAKLIKSGADPGSIVALTFTTKAATEMVDRINDIRGGYGLDLKVMTYNAYGEELLRRFAADIGLNSNLKLMEDAAQLVFLRERLADLELDYYQPLTNPDGHLNDLIEYFSRLKQNVVRPVDYRSYVAKLPGRDQADKLEKARHGELARAFEKYLQLCKAHNVIDYDDQIYLTLDLFNGRPNVLRKVRQGIEYLLVDEFQDTNAMQSDFLDALAGDDSNIMVVGDDDQSIYGWRGATLDNILSFKSRYRQVSEVILTQNYRSTQAILDHSYRLIKHNDPHRLEAQHGFNKRLTAKLTGQPPVFKFFATFADELDFLASDIQRRLDAGQDPGSIAILARGHTTLGRVHDYLERSGLDHNLAGISHDLYTQPVINDLIFVLRAIADPQDNVAVYQALISFLFDDISPAKLSRLSARTKREQAALIELAGQSEDQALKTATTALIQWHEASGSRKVSQTLYDIFKSHVETWLEHLSSQPDGEAQAMAAIRDIKELFEIMQEFERVALRVNVRGFIDSVATLKAAGQSVADDSHLLNADSVNLLTVHKAKGLEWDTVYIAGLTQNNFPSRTGSYGIDLPPPLVRSAAADDRLLEERRLMYVAMTRARQDLIMSASERLRPGSPRQRVSQFIPEIFERTDFTLETKGPTEPFELLPPIDDFVAEVALPESLLKGGRLSLSASQIETYVFCPLNFYYKYVLNWPEADSRESAIGQAVHELTAQINRDFADGRATTRSQIKAYLRELWPVEGFSSAQDRQAELTRAEQAISQFLDREKVAKIHPDLIEEKFYFLLDEGQIRVNGRYDAAYSRQPVEIRDYKTTQVGDQVAADAKAKKSYQLGIYALAWLENYGHIPETLSLDFVTSGLIGRSKRSQRQVDNTRAKIVDIAADIKAMKFPPKGEHKLCVHPPIKSGA